MTNKTRNISPLQYLDTLQKEYVICKLRSKIYPKQKDKLYWLKVCSYKEGIIKEISERNQLTSIFESKESLQQFENLVIPMYGIPLFVYKNEVEKEELTKKDFFSYFSKGSEVKFILNELEYDLGVIKNNSSEYLTIETSETEIEVHFSQVRRII